MGFDKNFQSFVAFVENGCILLLSPEDDGDEVLSPFHNRRHRMEKKTYTVRYTEHTWIDIEVKASSKEEAEEKAREMVLNGEVDLSDSEIDKSEYEVVDEGDDQR